MTEPLAWTHDEGSIAEKWNRLSTAIDDLARGRLCFEHDCVARSTNALVVSGPRRFEIGLCGEHLALAREVGLGPRWRLGKVRPLSRDEVLDGPAVSERPSRRHRRRR